MPVVQVPKERLNLGWELSPERLQCYAQLALSSEEQREASTNAYYALMMALHWLEIINLGHKTTCHSERIDTELEMTLSGLWPRVPIDKRRQTEAWIVFYYWIVGHWGGDANSARLPQVQSALASFLGFFFDSIGEAERLGHVLVASRDSSVLLEDAELLRLREEVKQLWMTLDVGEW